MQWDSRGRVVLDNSEEDKDEERHEEEFKYKNKQQKGFNKTNKTQKISAGHFVAYRVLGEDRNDL